MLKAAAWGFLIALYLRFGLEPTGWFFYEISHALGMDFLYWGYSIFRGGGYAFSLWPYQSFVCVLTGIFVAIIIFWRSQAGAKI